MTTTFVITHEHLQLIGQCTFSIRGFPIRLLQIAGQSVKDTMYAQDYTALVLTAAKVLGVTCVRTYPHSDSISDEDGLRVERLLQELPVVLNIMCCNPGHSLVGAWANEGGEFRYLGDEPEPEPELATD